MTPEDWENLARMFERVREQVIGSVQPMLDALRPLEQQAAASAIPPALAHQIKQMQPIIDRALDELEKQMWSRYRLAGAPYGDSTEARDRWMDEQVEIEHAREKSGEAEQLAIWHQMLADLRELLRRLGDDFGDDVDTTPPAAH